MLSAILSGKEWGWKRPKSMENYKHKVKPKIKRYEAGIN
jgi:hypothetical protein